MEIIFNKPIFLYLLVLVPIMIIFHFISAKYSMRKGILFANFQVMKRISKKYSLSNHTSLLVLRICILTAIILVLAQTFVVYEGQGDSSNYLIAIDNSMSMMSKDVINSRLNIAKSSSINFVDNFSTSTYFGIISFATVSKVKTILTDDKFIVKKKISEIDYEKNYGTNIGNAIINGVNLLLTEQGGRKLILITDGQSNSGVDIDEALRYAIENNVVVYTMAIGSSQGGKIDNLDMVFEVNDELLKEIANSTNGKYYSIKLETDAIDAYKDIKSDKYQKLKINFTEPLLLLLFFLLVVEFVFVKTIYKITP
jgi:Ca-activated chloride channel family protein